MELAFHLKIFERIKDPRDFLRHIDRFYGGKSDGIYDNYADLFRYEGRIYIGDEFCFHRLPLLDELKRLEKENIKFTLLTPPVTNEGLKKCARLIDYLIKFDGSEAVINDWGLLHFIKKNYPDFKLSAGRLLNKGFKDPRLSKNNEDNKDEFLTSSTFDNSVFRRKMIELGISRLERDVLPYQNISEFRTRDDLPESFYFPFGYITTGRVCMTSLLQKQRGGKLAIVERCAEPCHDRLFELKNGSFLFSVFQKGNTVFYLYPVSMLEALIDKAGSEDIRMVYL